MVRFKELACPLGIARWTQVQTPFGSSVFVHLHKGLSAWRKEEVRRVIAFARASFGRANVNEKQKRGEKGGNMEHGEIEKKTKITEKKQKEGRGKNEE